MQKEIKYWYLRNYNLFSNLTKEQIHDLSAISKFVRMKKNNTIYFSNDEVKKTLLPYQRKNQNQRDGRKR